MLLSVLVKTVIPNVERLALAVTLEGARPPPIEIVPMHRQPIL